MTSSLRRSQPLSTYRLQVHPGWPLSEAIEQLDYFEQLGVSHLYCSPLFAARSGSSHGYDVVDPNKINDAVGGETALRDLSYALHRRSMGLLLDIVPNHMAVSCENHYWMHVLRFGYFSPYARWFDIDWSSGRKHKNSGKIVLPVLGSTLRQAMRNGELSVKYIAEQFVIRYYETDFPLSPFSLPYLLELGLPASSTDTSLTALHNRLHALRALAKQDVSLAQADELVEQAEQIESSLIAELRNCSASQQLLEHALAEVHNSDRDFLAFRRLVRMQAYQLTYWGRIRFQNSYRRFFDISELVAVRNEDPTVLHQTHRLLRELVHTGVVDAVRVDHIDGLLEPNDYLHRLQSEIIGLPDGNFPVYVEKILAEHEKLPNWPVEGTTGYEFLNKSLHLFVDHEGFRKVEGQYQTHQLPFSDIDAAIAHGKRRILERSLLPDLTRLAKRIQQTAPQEERFQDLTLTQLRGALIELIVHIPVYRGYVSRVRHEYPAEAEALFRNAIDQSLATGRAHSTALELLRMVLCAPWEVPEGEPWRESCIESILRLQQLSAPAAAKGVEDTALYTYTPLVALNEVGGEPKIGEDSAVEQFHNYCSHVASAWPRTMLTVSTHDTKRSADVRSRLLVLSELPNEWAAVLRQCVSSSRTFRSRISNHKPFFPDWNTQQFIFQNIIGAWPYGHSTRDTTTLLLPRIQEYLRKSIREAKVYTSWTKQNAAYESAVERFVEQVLNADEITDPVTTIESFVERIAQAGAANSLAERTLLLTAPGIPDVYQGDELWNFSLVDPDNRRAVDFPAARTTLNSITAALGSTTGEERTSYLRSLLDSFQDGRCKLFTIYTLMQLRKEFPELFLHGTYKALTVQGPAAEHVIAFLRETSGVQCMVIVPRKPFTLAGKHCLQTHTEHWQDTRVELPDAHRDTAWYSVFGNEEVQPSTDEKTRTTLPAAAALKHWPTAVLLSAKRTAIS